MVRALRLWPRLAAAPLIGELATRLPYSHHVTEDIVALDTGALAIGFELRGVSFETSDLGEVHRRAEQLNHTWRNLADERLAIWHHVLRRSQEDVEPREFQSAFARDLDQQYRQALSRRRLFTNRLCLVLVLRAPSNAGGFSWRPGAQGGAEALARTQERLEAAARDLEQLLAAYGPRRLTLQARDGRFYSELLELVGDVLTGSTTPAPLICGRASGAVTTARLIFGREALEIRWADRSHYGALFSLKEYPAATPPGLWDGLLSLPFPLTITQSFAFLSKPAAQAVMARKQNQLVSTRDLAASQVDALGEALDDLISNRFVMGEHHASVMVLAETPEALTANLALTRARLAEGGLVAARDDLGLQSSFWAQCPGAFSDRLRPAPITSRNFSSLAPFHTHPCGPVRDLWWDQPVALLRSSSGSAFRFSFHVRDVGHTFICGPTGSGKTVVQNFLLSQAEPLGAQRILIDKDRGAEVFVRASGGAYLRFEPGRPSGLAPLKTLPLTPANQAHLKALVEALVAEPQAPLSSGQRREIDSAIAALEPMPPESRTFQALRSLLGQRSTTGLSARLAPWCAGQPLGWVFDETERELALTTSLIGLDITQILDAPQVRTPLLMDLLHRLALMADGRRLMVCFDEFWKALGDEAFRAFAQDGLKTFRKQNALLMLATQSPADVLQSPIAHTLVEQCATKVFLPNPLAQAHDYVDGFGLSQRELALVRDELAPGSGRFLVKQGASAVVAELDLRDLPDELAVLSGRTTTVELMETLQARLGETPEAWLPAFRESWRSTP